jgi:two-component system response regulator YesN
MPEHVILEAENGREALELAGEERLDAAFLDIRMPGIDGMEAARVLRARFPELPIVFLTAHDSFDYARTAVRLHVEDFLLKPASDEEVKASLARALSVSAGSRASSRPVEALLESAVNYLAEELRAELAADRVPAEKVERYLRLEGKTGEVKAVACLRPAMLERGHGQIGRKAELRSIASLFEQGFSAGELLALAGSGPDQVLCLLAGEPGEELSESSLVARFEALLSRARAELGLAIIAGIAVRTRELEPAADGGAGRLPSAAAASTAELCGAARRVAALATSARPLIVCPLAEQGQARREAESDGAPSGRRTALRALELLETRHAEDLSLEGVAAELGVSSSHLSRLLGRFAGLGFADCLARFRIERAKAFLASGSVSVKEVSLMVGFRDPAYFARVFRRFEDMSPAEYRARRPRGAAAREGEDA